jgi:hypothetical protein
MKKIIAASLAAILAIVALVVNAGPANAQPTGSIDIVVGDEGQLIAKGAAVTVPIEVTCSFSGDFLFATAFASLRQVKGKTLITAEEALGLSSTDCDGTTHTFDLTFFGDAPFNSGVAVIDAGATVGFVDPTTGEQFIVSDSEGLKEIRLKN